MARSRLGGDRRLLASLDRKPANALVFNMESLFVSLSGRVHFIDPLVLRKGSVQLALTPDGGTIPFSDDEFGSARVDNRVRVARSRSGSDLRRS